MTPLPLRDPFGRILNYLRISVTDRCNFRCIYCIPPEGLRWIPGENILTFDEIARVAGVFLEMGGKKIRITGGEPLVRKNVVCLIAQLAKLRGLEELCLTTNGHFLKDLAGPLKEAGLNGVNISLDSLSPSRFSKVTRSPRFGKVWEGIEAALLAGLKTKINIVVLKGMTEGEILAFGRMALVLPVEIRFIEFMPLCGTGWHPEWMLPLREAQSCLKGRYELSPVPRGSDVAKVYRIAGGEGTLGFIASMTEPFCKDCSRLRLSADGKLRPCLFSNTEVDLLEHLRNGCSDQEIERLVGIAVSKKPAGHGVEFPIQNAAQLPRIHSFGG